jgi:hypothetical protein
MMQDDKEPPRETIKSVTLEKGKSVKIGINRAVNFRIETVGGTVIEGVIPSSEYLTITSGGDLKSCDVNIYDMPSGPEIVE